MNYKNPVIEELQAFGDEVIKKHPHFKDEVVELLELCISEIEEGSSCQHEVNLCWSDLEDLMNTKIEL
jgi:hypothetical protein